MSNYGCCSILILFTLLCCNDKSSDERLRIAEAMERSIKTELLNKWYPQCRDTVYGGFFSSYTYDFQLTGTQNKMIVTQARHIWTNSKAAQAFPAEKHYLISAEHGFKFLRDVMWDKTYGGFHTLVDRQGTVISNRNEEKTAYGNSFGIYGLAAYYKASQDTGALNLAKKAFMWMEQHSHDPVYKGYFQHMRRDGTPIERTDSIPSTAETGYKDQNNSIHLLEAFTELYQIWPDSLVRTRLEEMLYLVRDVITTEKGYLTLFFLRDWTPVSFQDSSETVIMQHRGLDHVSFGHDVETAYLMLEASHVLGIHNDTSTLRIAKKMVDHALMNGWDEEAGGFYDEGYYFKGEDKIRIIRDTKNWWAQAEGMNALLYMSQRFPDDEMHYYDKFRKMWDYIDTYLIDHEHGDWYGGGLDKEPEQKTKLKGHIWKGTYHHYRALENCIRMLREGEGHDA
jgi:mannobiose 2-epimerase